jgi:hypothetical protein
MMMLTTHGLFLTCTQKLYLYIYTTHHQLFGPEPLVKMLKKTPLSWKVNVLLMVANPHPLWSLAWQQLPTLYFLIPPHPLLTPWAHKIKLK